MAVSSPPPELEVQTASETDEPTKPANISDSYWQRFQQLKTRRQKQHKKSSKRRAEKLKQSALKAVRQHVTVQDIKDVLDYEGITIESPSSSKQREESETTTWREVRQYLDPNPQLKGLNKGQYEEKSELKHQLDDAVERGRYVDAVEISDKMVKRKLACQIADAFDCHKYVQRRKADEAKRKTKLKWRYEHKQRWEMKGNM